MNERAVQIVEQLSAEYFEPVRSLCLDLRRVVTIHEEMLQKLLFKRDDLPLELAELLEDVANLYQDFSDQISRRWLEDRLPEG